MTEELLNIIDYLKDMAKKTGAIAKIELKTIDGFTVVLSACKNNDKKDDKNDDEYDYEDDNEDDNEDDE